MFATISLLAVLALLGVAAVYDQHRRRPVLEATIPDKTSRSARRRILRAQRVDRRAERIRCEATHPYLFLGW